MNTYYSFFISLLAGLSTVVGALIAFIRTNNTNGVINKSLSFSSGVMIAISLIDLIPSSFSYLSKNFYLIPSLIITLIGIVLGILLALFINKFVFVRENKKLYKIGIVSMISLILHNIPEGIITYMTSTINIKMGINLAIAIALHNIPEGICISVPVYYSTSSKKKALLYTFISGISEFLGALIAYIIFKNYSSDVFMGLILSLVAGIMLSLSFYELIPTSINYGSLKKSLIGIGVGIVFMCFCNSII